MAERGALIEDFLARQGWAQAARMPLPADASFRRYVRLARGDETALLMDAPPPEEDVRPYIAIARALNTAGFATPSVLAEDRAHGLLLIEDFGDATYTRLLDAGADPEPLYGLAVDVLTALHARPLAEIAPAGTPPYDETKLLDEASLLPDWYIPAVTGREVSEAARAAYRARWRDALKATHAVPTTLVLRDFHVDNLMLIDGRSGIASCGLLDFQDAVVGPTAYDFVSLVEDARRDVPESLTAALRARYLAAFPALDPAAFDRAAAVLGAQRHCKVIGIFTRLLVRDGKPGYLVHIPRLWRLLERAAARPELAGVADWLDAELPARARIIPDRRPAA